jgi:hypothetical protein
MATTRIQSELEKLSVAELKATLEKIWRKHEKLCREQMAPLLYHLRLKLKAQGKSGAGFDAWVEDHLDIARADIFAGRTHEESDIRSVTKRKHFESPGQRN